MALSAVLRVPSLAAKRGFSATTLLAHNKNFIPPGGIGGTGTIARSFLGGVSPVRSEILQAQRRRFLHARGQIQAGGQLAAQQNIATELGRFVQTCMGNAGVAFSRYRTLSQASPFLMGFGVCFAKGIIADTLAQKVIERRRDLDLRRMLAMALFSGTFCGCAYHVIFNTVFTRLWGTARSLSNLFAKVAADGLVVFPLLYMPTYFFFDETVRFCSMSNIAARWSNEMDETMRNYVKIWPATMVCVFTIVPVELRVSFIAGVSLVWLIILSVISH